jgi:hypothetical protein
MLFTTGYFLLNKNESNKQLLLKYLPQYLTKKKNTPKELGKIK